MIAFLRRSYQFFARRPVLRVALQALISIAILGLLIRIAQQGDLVDSLRGIRFDALALGFGIQLFAFSLNSYRWRILLANVGVNERFHHLLGLYHIGLFFSFFLPSGAGGDAVRMYDVARRHGRLAQVILATLQERLLGLGASLSVGLIATVYYLPLLPSALRLWVLLAAVGGTSVVAVLLYPHLFFIALHFIQRILGQRAWYQRIAGNRLITRAAAAVAPIAELPRLPLRRLALLLVVSHLSIFLGIAMYYVLASSLALPLPYTALCLAVPLTWIVRMAPISLGGIGVGEGAFVVMLGLFAIPADQSLAVALGFLGLQTAGALVGGALLAARMMRGTWSRDAQTPPDAKRAPGSLDERTGGD